jgi:predicted dehydrogenase
MRRVRDILREGGIGPVTMLSADFGFRADFDPRSRLFDPALGGGALLDVGVYCVSLASMVLGNPTGVRAHAVMAPTGVDARSGYLLSYASGALAVLYATVTAQTPWEASIVGDKGRIRIHPPFWKPSRITVSRSGEADQTVDAPYEGNGYQFEVEEVCRCLRGGLWESPEMPHDESIEIMETLDSIRAEIGLRYPGE